MIIYASDGITYSGLCMAPYKLQDCYETSPYIQGKITKMLQIAPTIHCLVTSTSTI